MAQRQHRRTRRSGARALGLCVVALCAMAIFSTPSAEATDPWLASLFVHPIEAGRESPGQPISDDKAKALARQQQMLERSGADLAAIEGFERTLGRSRCRKLAEARFHFDRFSPDVGRDLRDSPEFFEEARDAVFSSWLKLQRERLEERVGVETWWHSKRDDRRQASGRKERVSLRLSPRLSDDALGLKMGLKRTGTWLDRASFRVRHDLDDDDTQFIFKFEDRSRFVHFSMTPDSYRAGDRLDLSVRFSW